MLKVGGLWVSPVEVENALVAHDAVLECGVVGREDHDGLVKPMAFVVLREPAPASAGAGEGAAAVRARAAGRVQAAALGRVRRRAAEDRDRQDPAVPAAGAGATFPGRRPSNPGMRDLRYAVRVLLKNPAFTLTAVADAGAVHRRQHRHLHRRRSRAAAAAAVSAARAAGDDHRATTRAAARRGRLVAERLHLGRAARRRRGGRSISAALSGLGGGVNLVAGDRASSVPQQRVSAGYFRVLGVAPELGREFSAEEDRVERSGGGGLEPRAVDPRLQRRSVDRRPLDHAARRAVHRGRRDAGLGAVGEPPSTSGRRCVRRRRARVAARTTVSSRG